MNGCNTNFRIACPRCPRSPWSEASRIEEEPGLTPKLWYGSPAYAKDGTVVCFFQPAEKFGTRYLTLGFNDAARLDDGTMWPSSYAITALSAADAVRVTELITRAIG